MYSVLIPHLYPSDISLASSLVATNLLRHLGLVVSILLLQFLDQLDVTLLCFLDGDTLIRNFLPGVVFGLALLLKSRI
jgi:hypothetical protein